ncbi:MAG TPA: hypothetical protein VF331_15390 [Polyangiales bacterium]
MSLATSSSRTSFRGTHTPPSTSDAGTGEQFPPPVSIADVDPAAIARRVPAPDGCRSLRAAYHLWLASTSCTADADCQVLEPCPIPGEVNACAAYVNKSVSVAKVRDLNATWSGRCTSAQLVCATPQPPRCQNGKCGETCPGVEVPSCPESCHTLEQFAASLGQKVCDRYFGACLEDTGNTCSCEFGQLVCKPTPFAAAGCPLTCSPRSTSRSPTDSDAGVGDAAVDAAAQATNDDAGGIPGSP